MAGGIFQVKLPSGGTVAASDILEMFDQLWRNLSSWSEVELVIPLYSGNLHPDAMIALARAMMWAKHQGLQLSVTGDLKNKNRVANYLSRTNLFGLCGIQPPGLPQAELDKIGLHLPIRHVQSSDDVFNAVNALVEMLLHQAQCSPGVLDGFEWALNEVIDNILVHSDSPIGGFVMGQTVTHLNCVRVAIGDIGRGIRTSLSERYPHLELERDAIVYATQKGVTRDPTVGQGNGLAGTRQIVEENGGTLVVSSGDWAVQFGAKVPKGRQHKDWVQHYMPGTQVVMTLYTNRPLHLENTLLGESTTMHLEMMYENDTGEREIVVKQHTPSCGNRPSGRMMRTLLMNVSGPDVLGVHIDFRGVRSISSSFADEFVGKFAKDVGVDKFRSTFRISTDNELHQSIINRAISTRGVETH